MTKLIPCLLLAAMIPLVSCTNHDSSPEKDNRLFELRVYHPHPGKLDALNDRFRNHTLALFERHGMDNIGYWVTEDADPKLTYLVAFEDEAERDSAWKAFLNDPEWKAVYAESIKDGYLVATIDSTLLRATDYSPALAQEQSDPERLFELRTYKTTEGNLSNLDARFRDHTLGLFEKHGATNLIYFHLEEGQDGADNTLIYLLAHESAEARDAMFEAFRADPDWQAARAASEENAGGSLTQPGGVTHQFLRPVDYSPIK